MLFTICFLLFLQFTQADYYKTNNGKVTFESNATMEKIVSSSGELKGIINPKDNTFSFYVSLDSFHGFNSELQKDHYIENYVESDKYPKAFFSGKIIEEINFDNPGLYEVRAKGNFELHGIKFNKIFNSKLYVLNAGRIKITSNFLLNLKEYNIKIPRLVHKKVAENIKVNVEAIMIKQK